MSGLLFPIIWTLGVIAAGLLYGWWADHNRDKSGSDIFGIGMAFDLIHAAFALLVTLVVWMGGLLIWSLWFR